MNKILLSIIAVILFAVPSFAQIPHNLTDNTIDEGIGSETLSTGIRKTIFFTIGDHVNCYSGTGNSYHAVENIQGGTFTVSRPITGAKTAIIEIYSPPGNNIWETSSGSSVHRKTNITLLGSSFSSANSVDTIAAVSSISNASIFGIVPLKDLWPSSADTGATSYLHITPGLIGDATFGAAANGGPPFRIRADVEGLKWLRLHVADVATAGTAYVKINLEE